MNFLKSLKDITDPQVREELKTRKKGSTVKTMVATKKIYTDSVRKLLQRFNETQEKPISLSTFLKLKPFDCLKPSEKEKQSGLCLNCLNPHVILKSINGYRISHSLVAHDSLTTYLTELEAGKRFEEMDANNNCKYYEYRRVEESCIGKNGERVECTRTARVDITEAVHMLIAKLLGLSKKNLKYRTCVDNCTSVFPLLKESYTGKFIELNFSQNLSLRPKMRYSQRISPEGNLPHIALLFNQQIYTLLGCIKTWLMNLACE